MQPPSLDWIDEGSRPGRYRPLHLEEVRDRLADLEKEMAPVDFEVGIGELEVHFHNGQLQTHVPDTDMPLEFTDHAARRLARAVLPPRFLGGLQALSQLSGLGDELATDSWGLFAQHQEDRQLLRTARLPDTQRRTVRSCHSTSYAPYSNLALVEDLLAEGGFHKMDVLDLRVSDRAMRIRLVEKGRVLEPAMPIPMVELWNSEVGLRRVSIHGGLWRLICTNGLGDWNQRHGQSWVHRGNVSRIRGELAQAAEHVSQNLQSLLEKWHQGWHVMIPHPPTWLATELEHHLAPRLLQPLLDHYNGRDASLPLTDVVESMTRLAQDRPCLLDQREMEREAAVLLQIGLSHPPAIA